MASPAPTDPRKVFLDASVLIAAAFSAHGVARDLVLAGIRGRMRPAIGQITLDETERNLTRKFPAALLVLTLILQALALELVTPSHALIEQVASMVALKDAPIVAGAIGTRAEYLASYDREHLLGQATMISATFGLAVATLDDTLKNIMNSGWVERGITRRRSCRPADAPATGDRRGPGIQCGGSDRPDVAGRAGAGRGRPRTRK
jgi:predicted nucleic acid-binding protein